MRKISSKTINKLPSLHTSEHSGERWQQ